MSTDTTSPTTSPTDLPTDGTTTAPTSTPGPAEVIGSLYERFGQGDVEGILALIDPQVDWSVDASGPGTERVPMLGNGIGHARVLSYFAGVAELEIHRFEPHTVHVDGDVVLVELRLDMSHRRSGRRAAMEEIHRFVVRDGRIVHYRPFTDTAALADLFAP